MNIWDCIKVTDELGELTDQCFEFTKTYCKGSQGKYVLAFGPLKLGDTLDVVIETDTKKEYISIVSSACELVKSQVFVVNPALTHSRNTL